MAQENSLIFILGYWINPYRAGDKEYYWFMCDEGKSEAKRLGELKQKRGQPSRFTNWVKGGNRYFKDEETFKRACKKVGMNPDL